MTPPVTITRPLLGTEIAAMTRVLADAFMDDPLYRCLAPSAPARERWLRWVMGVFLRVSHRSGSALCLEPSPAAGVICLVPPERNPLALGDFVRAVPGPPPLGAGLAAFVRRGAGAARLLREAHLAGAHYYVLALGVAPGKQGNGVGGALVRAALHLAGARAVPCYLETASATNVAIYEHLGFRVHRTFKVPDLPPLWTMQREAARLPVAARGAA